MVSPLMQPEDVAKILGVKVKNVHEYVRKGELACVQLSPKDRKFTEAQVQDFIQRQTISSSKLVDKKPSNPLGSGRKGGVRRKSTRVSEAGLLIREEIKKLCQ
jgi:hypothetical protein